jgi:hypothetical protein
MTWKRKMRNTRNTIPDSVEIQEHLIEAHMQNKAHHQMI